MRSELLFRTAAVALYSALQSFADFEAVVRLPSAHRNWSEGRSAQTVVVTAGHLQESVLPINLGRYGRQPGIFRQAAKSL